MFKKKKSIRLSYKKQGLIYFTCLTYSLQPPNIQKRILNLCTEAAGEDFAALFDVLTDNCKTLERIAADFYLSPRKLSDYRVKFYELWDKRFFKSCR